MHIPASMNVLGVVDVSLDLSTVDAEIAVSRSGCFIISAVLAVLSRVFIICLHAQYVDAPIQKLIEGTRAVSVMKLDKPVDINSSEELGELARSFDTMRVQLKRRSTS